MTPRNGFRFSVSPVKTGISRRHMEAWEGRSKSSVPSPAHKAGTRQCVTLFDMQSRHKFQALSTPDNLDLGSPKGIFVRGEHK